MGHFSPMRNGVVCEKCLPQAGQVLTLNASALYAAQYIITSPIEKLYTFNVSSEVLRQLQKMMEYYIREHIDKTFKSLEILNIMENSGGI
ncbi:MAG TPA: hypothetical protein DCR27_12920 [Lachnospiraceae bacterium]|nr:hypothetical protein [Lachnospiraceae bacterium]